MKEYRICIADKKTGAGRGQETGILFGVALVSNVAIM